MHLNASGTTTSYIAWFNLLSHDQIVTLFNEDEGLAILKFVFGLPVKIYTQLIFKKINVKLAVQVLSDSVAAMALISIEIIPMKNITKKFKYTSHIEELFRLLNATFDILNARHKYAPAINAENWGKKEVLISVCHLLIRF